MKKLVSMMFVMAMIIGIIVPVYANNEEHKIETKTEAEVEAKISKEESDVRVGGGDSHNFKGERKTTYETRENLEDIKDEMEYSSDVNNLVFATIDVMLEWARLPYGISYLIDDIYFENYEIIRDALDDYPDSGVFQVKYTLYTCEIPNVAYIKIRKVKGL